MILITVLGTMVLGARITIFLYCKHKNAPTHSRRTLSILWHKENTNETKPMLSGSPQQSTGYPKIKETIEKAKEALEILGIDFSDFNKCKTCRNSKDRGKTATTFG